MITDAFSTASEPVISRETIFGPQRHLADVCIVTFSDVIFQSVLETFACAQIAQIRACNGTRPICAFDYMGRKIACYLSSVGSAGAATDLLEANWLTGTSRFIVFGSCGCLNREAAQGRYVIPTAAFRDEGMSYHYAPPADYIDMPGAQTTASVFSRWGIPCVQGRVWTTDAFYRELRSQMEQRKAEGCLAVDMEAAGMQAVCDFHGLQLYYFLMTGDVLDLPEWDVGELRTANHHLDNFRIALKIAEAV